MARVYGDGRQRAAALNFDRTEPGWPLDLSDWDGWARLWRRASRPRDIASSATTSCRAKRQLAITGISHCVSPAEVAAGADVIITSLPGPAEVADVVYGARRSAQFASAVDDPCRNQHDLSGAEPDDRERFRGAQFVLSRRVQSAAARKALATALWSRWSVAQRRLLERARPIISCFAKEIFHLGPVGAGNVMKLVIQSIFLSQMASFLEAVSMGERSGIPLDTLLRHRGGVFGPSSGDWHPVRQAEDRATSIRSSKSVRQ